ncbi:MAG: hypothetical protein WD850_02955 [Candidatus Spechtbacterales bacterium]
MKTLTYITALAVSVALLAGVALPMTADAIEGDVMMTLAVDKHEVNPGDTVSFTATVKNNTDVKLTNVMIAGEIVDGPISYINGSGFYKHSDSTLVHAMSNTWYSTTSANAGYIEPGQHVTVTWDMKVANNAPRNTWLQVTFDSWSDQVNEIPLTNKQIYVKQTLAPHLVLSKTADRLTVAPGELITYTIRLENDGNTVFDNVQLLENLPNNSTKWVTYVAGTGERNIDGDIKALPDRWITDGYELAYLNPGQVLVVTFKVRVNTNAPDGLKLQNEVTLRADELDEPAQAAAATTVKVAPVTTKKPELPKTGAGLIAVAIFLSGGGMLGSGVVYGIKKGIFLG